MTEADLIARLLAVKSKGLDRGRIYTDPATLLGDRVKESLSELSTYRLLLAQYEAELLQQRKDRTG